jgi:competence protein ComEA
MHLMVRTFLFLLLVIAPGQSEGHAQNLPDGPGKDVTVKICSDCHALDSVSSMRQSRAGWEAVVNQMVGFGASGTQEELTVVIDYLTRNFGIGSSKDEPKVNVNKATAKEIQERLDFPQKIAEAIVAYRQQHDAFKEWRDLLRVQGVDPKKAEEVKDRIAF